MATATQGATRMSGSKICCLWMLLLNVGLIAGKSTHTIDNVLDFFGDTDNDGLNIIWAHAVNSKALLEEHCTDDTMMLETDIILRGIGTENQTNIPVHAHPPDTDSDVTLVEWLDRATQEPDVGMKLDFKYIEAVEPSMIIIKEKEDQLHAPLWINADIVVGPNSPKDPIPAKRFIDTCNKYFSLTTMSLGFTTFWNETTTEDMYTWQMIFDSLQYTYPLQQSVTFPIRALWCVRSWSKFTWLLGLKDDFSITIWSGSKDVVDVTGLLNLRIHGDTKRIYYDLPGPLMAEFKKALEDGIVQPTPEPRKWDSNLWQSVSSGSEGDFVFLSTESVGIMGGQSSNSYAGWVQSKDQQIPKGNMFIRGIVQFVNKYGNNSSETTTKLQVAFRTSASESEGGVIDGIKIYITNDGSIGIHDSRSGNDVETIQALPNAECYYFEVRDDTFMSSCNLEVEIVRCNDAVISPPHEGQTAKLTNVSVSSIEEFDSFYVKFGKVGYSKDIIVEDFYVEVSGAAQIQCLFCLMLLVIVSPALFSE